MLRKQFTVGLAFVLVTVLTAGAEAKTINFTGTGSGSALSTEIDTNNDGQKASLSTGGGKTSQFSSFTSQVLIEYAVTGPTTCNSHAGVGLALVPGTGHGVLRFGNGDLLVLDYTDSTGCFDSVENVSFLSSTADIVGGTGRFANATGSLNSTATSIRLFVQPSANRSFQAVTSEFSVELTLP